MQHHTYVLIDGRITIYGSVNLIQHAMVSAGILVIFEDMQMVQPLARHFANDGDHIIYRSTQAVKPQKTQPCYHCAGHEKRTG